jgi:hypothetical protein
MDTTIDEQTPEVAPAPVRRPRRSALDVVVPAAEAGIRRRQTRVQIAQGLEMKPSDLLKSLRRAGRFDLVDTLYPEGRTLEVDAEIAEAERQLAGLTPEQVRTVQDEAARILAQLPVEDPRIIEQRRRDLLAELPLEPRGRPMLFPGGIVRWVAA